MNIENWSLIERATRIFNKYMEIESKEREYSPGIILYPSEIHTIDAIGKNPQLNVTELAEKLGVTKGTISKALRKLEDKGLIERFKKSDNNKEVYIRLTQEGRKAFDGHERYHAQLYFETNKYLNNLNEKEKKIIEGYLMKSEELLNKYI